MEDKIFRVSIEWICTNSVINTINRITTKDVQATNKRQAISKLKAWLKENDKKLVSIGKSDAYETEIEDDRIFSVNDMADFAIRMAQEAMVAAFEGKKNINGMGLEEYIIQEAEKEEGDDSSDYCERMKNLIK